VTGKRAPGARTKRVPLPVVLGLMLVGGLCALLALNTASAAQEIMQRHITDANATTSDTEQQLLRDLAAKQAPGSLASAAASLGLVANPNPAFLRINRDGSVTVLGSPTPATAAPPPPTPTPSLHRVKPSTSATGKPSTSKSTGPTATRPGQHAAPTAHPTTPAVGGNR
jgi:cell division septation protein DedD